MPHFVCTGECGGRAEQPGSCREASCTQHDQALTECHCSDGQHAESDLVAASDDEEADEETDTKSAL